MQKFLTVFFLVMLGNVTLAQMNYASFLPNTFRANGGSFTAIAGAPTSGSYMIANAMYDELGNVKFYTADSYVVGAVSGSGSLSSGSETVDVTDEIIIPKPGSCNDFYVVYVVYNPSQQKTSLRFVTVTGNNGTITVSAFSDLLVETNHHGSIAISKKQSSGNRFLFYGSPAGIKRFTISSTGINTQTALSTTGVYSNELELNETSSGWKLAWAGATSGAWAGYGNTINILPLTTSGNVSGAITNTNFSTYSQTSRVTGLEFISSTMVCAALSYNSGNTANGVFRVTLSNGTSSKLTNSTTYCLTQLEKYGNEIYGVGNNQIGGLAKLIRMGNISADVVTGSPTDIFTWSNDGHYFVPRGVDDENYNTILTGASPVVAATWPHNPCPNELITATVSNQQGSTNYSWYGSSLTGAPFATGISATFIYTGPVYVRAVNTTSGCSSLAAPYSDIYQNCNGGNGGSGNRTAVTQQVNMPLIKIYPNPTESGINVVHPTNIDNLSIYDIAGKLVLNIPTEGKTENELNLDGLQDGIYLLKVEGYPMQKIVKQARN